MFEFLKKKKEMEIMSPVKGKAVALSMVSDPTFGKEMLGKGIALIPEEGKFYAPCDGTIETLFDTLHAISMTTTDGVELLIHIGLDTVQLNGKYFQAAVSEASKVKKGDLMITADLDAIKAEGYDVITPVIVCNTPDYEKIESVLGNEVTKDDVILRLKK